MPSGGSRRCKPGCGCNRHHHGTKPIESHPTNCKCVVHKALRENRPAVCPPGCDCAKHNKPKCPPGCKCGRHRMRKTRKQLRDERCVCGHLIGTHDMFGCHTCDGQDDGTGKPIRTCSQFRPETQPPPTNNLNDQRIAEANMLKHVGDIATCTKCLMPVKIGKPGTLAAVIAARAHTQLCKASRESHGRQAI